MDNTKVRREAAILVIVVFLLGVLLGAVGNHVWGERVSSNHVQIRPNTYRPKNQVIADFTKELELTSDQQAKLGEIIDQTRAQWNALYAPLQPEHEKIRQDSRNRIRAILTPEQQTKFDAFMQRLDEQRRNQGNSAH
ncbi:MAG TPA: Spy/CpxP family protein refolding chaperone [Candidatus Acidoferrales bacterium]|nr:Spy/CpxP family protein refolding chaperone [Candidatus Acidoferrales bacterium]